MPRSRMLSVVVATLAMVSTLPAQEIARAVPPGREVRDTKLLTLGKTDRWDLTVAAGEMLWCVVESSTFDPVLELVDSDGNVLGRHDGEGTRSELWRRMRVASRVAFRVQGFEGSGGGHYNFWLQHYRTEDLQPGGAAKHKFGRDKWWHYLVPLKAGDVLVPTASGAGRVTAVYDMQRKGVGAVMGGYRAPHDGSYFVRIEGRRGRTSRFECALARQRPLPEDGAVRDAIPPHGFDFWRVWLQAGEAYAFHLQMPEAQLAFDLREPVPGRGPAFVWTGTLDKGGSRRRWLVARRDCNLELLLRNKTGAQASYRASLRAPSAGLVEGTPVEETLALGGGDVYRLPTVPGQLLRVSMASGAFDGQIDLWDPDGNVVVRCDDAGPMDRNPSLTFLVVRPGCHRLLVFSPGGCGGGAYSLRVDSIAVPQLDFERPLELTVAARATTYCHLRLTRNQEVWLSLRSREFDVAVTVLVPDGRRIGTWEGGGIGGDVLTAFAAPTGGRYTLQVHSRSRAGTCEVRAVRP